VKKEIKANNLTRFVDENDCELLEAVQNVADLCETSICDERQKKYASALLTLAQYFLGLDDDVSIIINGENDRGKYVIKIIQ